MSGYGAVLTACEARREAGAKVSRVVVAGPRLRRQLTTGWAATGARAGRSAGTAWAVSADGAPPVS